MHLPVDCIWLKTIPSSSGIPLVIASVVAEPAPDQVRDGLIWYGQRSFGAGEPRLVFEKSGVPWLPLLLGGLLCVLILGGLYVVLSKRRVS